MKKIKIRCKQCGKKLLTYSQMSYRRYKSPINVCKKCGTRYADPRCHEIAVEGIPEDEFSASPRVITIIIGALVLCRGLYLFGMYEIGVPDNMQWLKPTIIAIAGLVIVLIGVAGIVAINSGIKEKKFEKLERESEQRLRNKNYARALQNLGYRVPKKYLED